MVTLSLRGHPRWTSCGRAKRHEKEGGALSLEDENQRLKTLLEALRQQVARQQDDLRNAARFKEDFIAMVSHDLRTPITVIRESLSQLDDRLFGEMNEDQAHLLKLALMNVDRLSACLNQFVRDAKDA
ncbi:MAG TPA: histidine kinase dimerization/phospho-acceptor domain-containing protein [Candidatus Omnitrophota bacterium]|nr:histidine kinase dimerization/phospho-acceptor domain-containing protein [Candidatus Omnitrophota bacterium]